jgi:hypothetical protein
MEQRTRGRSARWSNAVALSVGLLAGLAGNASAQAPAAAPPATPVEEVPGAINPGLPQISGQLPFPVPGSTFGQTLLVVAEGTVYVLRGDTLLAFDAKTLALKAQAQLPSAPRRVITPRYTVPRGAGQPSAAPSLERLPTPAPAEERPSTNVVPTPVPVTPVEPRSR